MKRGNIGFYGAEVTLVIQRPSCPFGLLNESDIQMGH